MWSAAVRFHKSPLTYRHTSLRIINSYRKGSEVLTSAKCKTRDIRNCKYARRYIENLRNAFMLHEVHLIALFNTIPFSWTRRMQRRNFASCTASYPASSGGRADFSVREYTVLNWTASSEMIAPAVRVNRLPDAFLNRLLCTRRGIKRWCRAPATCFTAGRSSARTIRLASLWLWFGQFGTICIWI